MRWVILLILLFVTIPSTAQDDYEWDGERRFTVLIMGMDRRPNARDTLQVRTDVMIVASIDPIERTAGLLHIPRDLHFTPADSDRFIRVNTLVLEGENQQEGYGPYYAMDVTQFNLGMYVDRYVLFDFEAFIHVIDAIGGIEITTNYTINDPTYPDMNYGYDPFYLARGTHQLDGRTALKYARTRHGDNDFERGQRQMQVIQAVQSQVASGDILLDLLPQVPQLLDDLEGKVYTDLSLREMTLLALNAQDIEALLTGGIDTDYNLVYALPSGNNAYVPDRNKLPDLLISVFGENYAQ